MLRKIRMFLWGIAVELEYLLYPYENDTEDDYYIKVKNDETGEKYFVLDWIKSHNDKIDRLQDEMIWVKHKINEISKNCIEKDDRI